MEENSGKKIRSFTDLESWKEAHKLAIEVYRVTEDFPQKEVFGLTNQIRRASVSVVSNIAEGFSRQTAKEKVQFYFISKGSNAEVQSQLLIARDIGYLSEGHFKRIADRSVQVSKLLTGMIRKCRE